MKLAPFLSLDTIDDNLQAGEGEEVLSSLSSLLIRTGHVPQGTDLVTILRNREELGSTGIGKGVAIPHVRLKNLAALRIAVGRSVEGVDFNAVDGQRVHFFFLIVAPESSRGDHLKVLAQVSRLLKKPGVRASLLKARGREEILSIIVSEDEKG